MLERGLYHYPKLTDLNTMRLDAIKTSLTEPVTLHFHPYSDKGCKAGLKLHGYDYLGLPSHERYVDGELQ